MEKEKDKSLPEPPRSLINEEHTPFPGKSLGTADEIKTGMAGDLQKGALAAYGNYLAQFGSINMQTKQYMHETRASAPFQLGTNRCASENGDSSFSQQAVVCFKVPSFTQSSSIIFIQ